MRNRQGSFAQSHSDVAAAGRPLELDREGEVVRSQRDNYGVPRRRLVDDGGGLRRDDGKSHVGVAIARKPEVDEPPTALLLHREIVDTRVEDHCTSGALLDLLPANYKRRRFAAHAWRAAVLLTGRHRQAE